MLSQGPLLGKGGYGKVFEAELGTQGVAAEKVCPWKWPSQGMASPEVRAAWNELTACAVLPPFFHTAFRTFFQQSSVHFIQLKYNPVPPLTAHNLGHFLSHIAQQIFQLHALGLLHGDIKPQNMLLSWEDKPSLIDFGSVKPDRPNKGRDGKTPQYWAPEIWRGEDFDWGSDLYSAGVSICQLFLGGNAPPTPEDIERFFYELPVNPKNPRLSALLKKFPDLEQLVHPDPEHRSCTGAIFHLKKRWRVHSDIDVHSPPCSLCTGIPTDLELPSFINPFLSVPKVYNKFTFRLHRMAYEGLFKEQDATVLHFLDTSLRLLEGIISHLGPLSLGRLIGQIFFIEVELGPTSLREDIIEMYRPILHHGIYNLDITDLPTEYISEDAWKLILINTFPLPETGTILQRVKARKCNHSLVESGMSDSN